MAARKAKTQDRGVMDASATRDKDNFMTKKAEDDKEDAKARHSRKGLEEAKKLASSLTKCVAHGLSSDSDDAKEMCLREASDIGNQVRDCSNAALRAAKTETRNIQA